MNEKMLDIITWIFDYENIPYEPITDINIITRHKRGHINLNQACGVYVYPNNPQLRTIITNFYEAIHFLETKAQRQC
jgi:hypothetical protein